MGKKKQKNVDRLSKKQEKKNAKELKKEIQQSGEIPIEELIKKKEIESNDKGNHVKFHQMESGPNRRCYGSFTAHPVKNELIMFGGEYYDGEKMYVYDDLFIYQVKKNQWVKVDYGTGPTGRSSHQIIATSRGKGGELWMFGGEFTSETQSQFYHLKQLWRLDLDTFQWEKIIAPNGPSARSGHSMVLHQNHLIVFGGFHDDLRICRYFNDLHIFSLDNREWIKVIDFGLVCTSFPTERSKAHLFSVPSCEKFPNGKIILFGGYSKEIPAELRTKSIEIQDENSVGHTHRDMFEFIPSFEVIQSTTTTTSSCIVKSKKNQKKKSAKDNSRNNIQLKSWTCSEVKQSKTSFQPSVRTSALFLPYLQKMNLEKKIPAIYSVYFGGVADYSKNNKNELVTDYEDGLCETTFFNDLYSYDSSRNKWRRMYERKKLSKAIKDDKIHKDDDDNDEEMGEGDKESLEIEQSSNVEAKEVSGEKFNLKIETEKIENDKRIFIDEHNYQDDDYETDEEDINKKVMVNAPRPRMSSMGCVKNSILYIFGGIFETKTSKQIFLQDFHSVNLQQINKGWNEIIRDDIQEKDVKNEDSESDSESETDTESESENELMD
ncbi:hypothetical protein SNEBB_010433 [Seison nebaliae]|nr:hypothetical protein SNEBB_010433 [Seison nebaliae]